MGAENLAATGIRSPDCPAHVLSLYRLRYLGPLQLVYIAHSLVLHLHYTDIYKHHWLWVIKLGY
jgi:hypothetical protein